MMRTSWISVALLATALAPTALADPDIEFDLETKAELEVEARAEGRYRYTWDWGDGETSVGVHSRHTYERAGTYRVVVVAVDDDGREYRRTREVEVRAAHEAPEFDVEVERASVRVEAERESRARFEWDFGDGRRSSGRVATHVYAEPGVYEVTLKVTHRDGECSYERRTVVVEGDRERDDEERASVSARVSLGWGGDDDEDEDEEEWDARRERHEWRGDTSVRSSSFEHNSVPGVGAPLAALGIGGAALVGRALRRR